jgi:hypothetical protein
MSSGRLGPTARETPSYQAARVALWRPKLIAAGREPGRTFEFARPDQTLGDIETIDVANFATSSGFSLDEALFHCIQALPTPSPFRESDRCHCPPHSPLSQPTGATICNISARD